MAEAVATGSMTATEHEEAWKQMGALMLLENVRTGSSCRPFQAGAAGGTPRASTRTAEPS